MILGRFHLILKLGEHSFSLFLVLPDLDPQTRQLVRTCLRFLAPKVNLLSELLTGQALATLLLMSDINDLRNQLLLQLIITGLILQGGNFLRIRANEFVDLALSGTVVHHLLGHK